MAPRAKATATAAEKEALLQIAPKQPPGPQCSNCLKYVSADVAFILCAHPACDNLPICVDCFRVGAADEFPHRTNHPYRVIARNDTPLYENDWTVDEEMRLLHALSTFGPHHWADVANYVGKTPRKCELHYQNVYHNGDNVPLATARTTNPRSSSNPPLAPNAPPAHLSSEPQSSTPNPLTAETLSADDESDDESVHPDPAHGNNTKVTGFMPKRFDLEVDYDDHAENLIADLVINPTDTDEEKDLKARLIEIYDQRLQRRDAARLFIQQKQMLNFSSLRCTDRRAPRDEKELSARLQVFSRLMPAQQFDQFYEAVTKQYRLCREHYRLTKCRQAGMKTRAEVDIYDVERKGRASNIASISKRKGRPLTATPTSSRKKRSTTLKRRRSTPTPGTPATPATPATPLTPATPATPASADVSEQGSDAGTAATQDCSDVVDMTTPQVGSPSGDGAQPACPVISDGNLDAAALRKARQWKRISKSPYPRVEAMSVDTLPDLHKLTNTEKRLCSMLHITPREFLCQRDAMLHTAARELHSADGEGDGKDDVIMLRCQPTACSEEGPLPNSGSKAPAHGGGDDGAQCVQVHGQGVETAGMVEVGMEANTISQRCGAYLDAESAGVVKAGMDANRISQDCGTYQIVAAAVAAAAYNEGDMRRNVSQQVGLETCAREDAGAGSVVPNGDNGAKDGLHDDETEREELLHRPVSVTADGSGPTCFDERGRGNAESADKADNRCDSGTQRLVTDIVQDNGFAGEGSVDGHDGNVGTSVMYGPNMEMEEVGLAPAENAGSSSNEVHLLTHIAGDLELMVEVDTRAVGSFGHAMKSDDSIGEHVREALEVVNADKKEEFSPVVDVDASREGDVNVMHICENEREVVRDENIRTNGHVQDGNIKENVHVQDENIKENVHEDVDEDCEDILVVTKRRRVGDDARESTCVHAVRTCEAVMKGMTEVQESKEIMSHMPEDGDVENGTVIKRNRVFVKRMDVEVPEFVPSDGDMPTIVKVEKRVVKAEGTESAMGGGRRRKSTRKMKRMREHDEVECVAEKRVAVKREIVLEDSEAVEEVLDGGRGYETCTGSGVEEVVIQPHEDDVEVETDPSAKESTPGLGTEEVVTSIPLKLRIRPQRRTRSKRNAKVVREERGFKSNRRRPTGGEGRRRDSIEQGEVILLTDSIEQKNKVLEAEVNCLDVDDDSAEEVLEEGRADEEPKGEVLNIPKETSSNASAELVLNIPKPSMSNAAPVLNIPKAPVANADVLEIADVGDSSSVEVVEIPKVADNNKLEVLNIPKPQHGTTSDANILNIAKLASKVGRAGESESDEAVVIVKAKMGVCRRSTRIHKRKRRDDGSQAEDAKRVKTEGEEDGGRADDDSCLYIPKALGLRRSARRPVRTRGKSPAPAVMAIGRAAATQVEAEVEIGCVNSRSPNASSRSARSSGVRRNS